MKWADCAVKPSGFLEEDEEDDDQDEYWDSEEEDEDEDSDKDLTGEESSFDIQNIDLSEVGKDLQHRCGGGRKLGCKL